MAELFKNYIAGEWVAGASATANRNPSDTSDVIGEYAQADAEQTRAAIAAAKKAFPAWSTGSIQERANILDRAGSEIIARKDELGALLSREEGKTLPEGIGEAMRAGQIFKFFAGEVVRLTGDKLASVRPGVDVEITREPLGVVGLITPWNFPIAIPAWKIAPALAYGNTVVFKPADLVPGMRVGDRRDPRARGLARRRVQPGDGARLGRRRSASSIIPTSRRSASPARWAPAARSRPRPSRGMAKIQLEMGGKNPLIVLDDADLPTAVNVAVQGSYFSTGQRCTASSRLIVTAGIHDRFVAAVTEKLNTLQASTTRCCRARTSVPVVDPSQLEQDLKYIDDRQGGGRQARHRRRAADSARPRATTCRRRCSPRRPTRCASRARKSSARSPA